MVEERHGAVTFKGGPLTALGPALSVGDTAPDFGLLDGSMAEVDLAGTGSGVRLFNVVPSLDTPVCATQTKRFDEALSGLEGVSAFTISADLPFAQGRFCSDNGIGRLTSLSDHRELAFGQAYGCAIKELRLLSRSVFVVDGQNTVRHAQYVTEIAEEPDYDAVLAALREALGQ